MFLRVETLLKITAKRAINQFLKIIGFLILIFYNSWTLYKSYYYYLFLKIKKHKKAPKKEGLTYE